MARSRSISTLAGRAALLLTFVLATLLSGSAAAQEQAAVDRLVQLNKRAMDDYDTADFDVARKMLLEAEKLGKRAGLEGHPVMARTYVHLGALYWVGYKDSKKAQHYFGKALAIQPDIKLDKNMVSGSLNKLFAKAQEQHGGAPRAEAADAAATPPAGDTSPPAGADAASAAAGAAGSEGAGQAAGAAAPENAPEVDPALPANIVALDCPYPDETPPGKKVVLRCAAAESLGVAKVQLFYKGLGMSSFETLDMARSSKGWWQVTVPKKRVEGTSLQFYFEGLDASGKPVVSNGRAESPNVMLIVESTNTAATAPVRSEAEENPLEEKEGETPKVLLGRYDASRVGIDRRYGNRRFWLGIGIGTGFTYAINGVAEASVMGFAPNPANMKPYMVTGFGWAGLGQAVPEIGWQPNPDWSVSIEGRNQWIYQPSKVSGYTASGAQSVFLKVLHYTKQNRLRFTYGLVAGGGEGVRMNIAIGSITDTIRIGGILFGPTGGVNYEISQGLSWIAEVKAMYGTPKSGFAFDVTSALQFNFGDTSGRAEKEAKRREDSVSTSVDDEDPK
jgi:hypothetical protein